MTIPPGQCSFIYIDVYFPNSVLLFVFVFFSHL